MALPNGYTEMPGKTCKITETSICSIEYLDNSGRKLHRWSYNYKYDFRVMHGFQNFNIFENNENIDVIRVSSSPLEFIASNTIEDLEFFYYIIDYNWARQKTNEKDFTKR